MGTKERILTIRLLEKIQEDPAYAESIGIEAKQEHPGADTNAGNGRYGQNLI